MEDDIETARAISRRQAFATAAKLGLGAGLGAAGVAGGIGTALADTASGGLPKKNFKFFFVCHVTPARASRR